MEAEKEARELAEEQRLADEAAAKAAENGEEPAEWNDENTCYKLLKVKKTTIPLFLNKTNT